MCAHWYWRILADDVYFVFPEGPGKEIACYGIAPIRNISRSGQADLPLLTAPRWVLGGAEYILYSLNLAFPMP